MCIDEVTDLDWRFQMTAVTSVVAYIRIDGLFLILRNKTKLHAFSLKKIFFIAFE